MHIPWFFSFLQICRSSLYIWDISPLCVISPSIFFLKLWYLVPIFFLLLLLYFLITSSLIMDYLNVCLVFKCWQIFLIIFVTCFSFNSIVFREHALYNFNSFKFVKVCFKAHDRVSSGQFLQALGSTYTLLLFVECCMNVD